jgi:hypothetical protein
MRRAYHHTDPLIAQAELEALARELDRSHPGAANSLREGLTETLTIGRLGVPPTLARTLRSTNTIESMIAICRDHASNVKRWRDGQMALRWVAAGMGEAATQFRRVNGYLHLAALRAALDATSLSHRPRRMPPPDHPWAATEVPWRSGHPRCTERRLAPTPGLCPAARIVPNSTAPPDEEPQCKFAA